LARRKAGTTGQRLARAWMRPKYSCFDSCLRPYCMGWRLI
jgi:hypothetical protein